MKKRKFLFALICLLTLVFSACNSKERLTGRVLFEDGEPLTFGTVYFTNGIMMYRGSINTDGTFNIGELRDGDGIPPGQYKAWLEDVNTWEPVLDQNGMRTDKIIEYIVMNPKFAKRESSDISFEVKPGSKNFIEIHVSKP